MKTLTKIFTLICLSAAITAGAQSEKYVQNMTAAIQSLNQGKTAEEMTAVAAKFERIGDAEKTEWLPYYYAGLAKARMSLYGLGDKDKLADEAGVLITKAEALSKDNSEILCVKSLIASAKLLVDPMSRWQEYGEISANHLAAAKKADPTNPRPYMLEANSLKNTPEQFGGGCSTAKPLAEKAITLYETFKPASTIAPDWGKESAAQVVKGCQ